jgi:hypothetical protein
LLEVREPADDVDNRIPNGGVVGRDHPRVPSVDILGHRRDVVGLVRRDFGKANLDEDLSGGDLDLAQRLQLLVTRGSERDHV